MSDDRDYCEEALSIIDSDSPLLAERAHLVALHHYHRTLHTLRKNRTLYLLRKLDAEHSHQEPCATCNWLIDQPEWVDVLDQWANERDA